MTRRVVQYLDGSEFGGAERAVVHLLARLDGTLWEPTLFCPARPSLEPVIAAARELGIPVYPLPDSSLPARMLAVVRSLRRVRPALFHAHLNWPLACGAGLAGARLAGAPPSVATVQLFGPLPRSTATRASIRLRQPLVDRYIAVSADIANSLRGELGVPSNRIDVVPNGVDLRSFRPSADRRIGVRNRLGISPSARMILTVARLEAQKGHRDLIRAASRIPGAVFVLVGDGPARAALAELTRDLELSRRVRWLGNRTDVPDLLAAADAFVLPSLYEGLPLAILEAMASGTPIVATRIAGVTEVLDDRTARLVPPGDPHILADAINEVLLDPVAAADRAKSARTRVAGYDWDFVAARILSVYEQLLEPPPVAPDSLETDP